MFFPGRAGSVFGLELING